jgi:hypothetical protein
VKLIAPAKRPVTLPMVTSIGELAPGPGIVAFGREALTD